MNYKRLSLEERESIHALVNQGYTNREIANSLNRAHSTISIELKRCKTRLEYSPSKAHEHAHGKNPERGRKRILDAYPEVLIEAFGQLFQNLSPEQISQGFKKKYVDETKKWISHESIYKYIYAFPR